MLAVATAKPPLRDAAPITYIECPADALDVPSVAFDVVVCQQGLQFFPDRVTALSEMRRAVKPGGRVGANVWCDIEHCPPFEALSIALGAVLGAEAQLAYRRGPWGLGDPGELTRLFEEAGLLDVRVNRRTLPICFEGGPAQLVATVPTSVVASEVAALGAQGRADLLAATTTALEPLREGGAVRSEMAAHVVRATR
jgi:SAM-dependent methyltransferase